MTSTNDESDEGRAITKRESGGSLSDRMVAVGWEAWESSGHDPANVIEACFQLASSEVDVWKERAELREDQRSEWSDRAWGLRMRFAAALRLVYPADMTPSGKRVFESVFEAEDWGPAVSVWSGPN